MSTTVEDPAWDQWFAQEVATRVDPAYWTLSTAVELALVGLREEGEALEGLHRDRFELFAPSPIKSAARVRSKLLLTGEVTGDDLLDRVLALGDLARFRIVATLKRDVEACRRGLLSADGAIFLGTFKVRGLKDFVRDERLRRPLAGHRALQLVVEVPSGDRAVRVEVQIMTQLQHTWDRRNHAMYEWLREGREQGVDGVDELRVDDHAVAESLHAIDALAEHNFTRFLALRGRP